MTGNVSFVTISDTHFQTEGTGLDSCCWNRLLCSRSLAAMPDLTARIRDLQPDFILHLGDLTNDGSRVSFLAGTEALARIGVPVHLVRGNHDVNEAQQLMADADGNCFSVFEQAGLLFVILDSCIRETELDPAAADKRKRIITDRQLQWLEHLLFAHKDQKVVICSHLPLYTKGTYAVKTMIGDIPVEGRTAGEIGRRIGYVGNSREVLQVIDRHPKVLMLLSGHWHISDICRFGTIPCVITPSISEYPCEFRHFSIDDEKIVIRNLPSGISPEDSYCPGNDNGFAYGQTADRDCVISLI